MRYKKSDFPTVEEYKHALLEHSSDMPHKHLEMLKVHYHAPRRTVTAAQLAKRVGYKNYNAANLQYGTLAGKLSEILNRHYDFNIRLLVTFRSNAIIEQVPWVMRPEVAQALEELDWV